MKYYMEKDNNWCFPLSEFKERIRAGEKEIFLEKMKKDIGGEMFCVEFWDFIDKGWCGLNCDRYEPCNQISGRCRFLKNGFIGIGKNFRLTKKGLETLK
ncbi:MAG: hypothetical protein EAX96_21295 [Candidatus Lokiarchaeota archaeon]|nr:hypothetical protein [Candidatus Lokiarchaeota archaeon]